MIVELSPHISKRIWGGEKLNNYKKIAIDRNADPIGETWEVSTHADGISKIKNSEELLSKIVDLKYLVKFLDTSDALSVQVHPHDEYSKVHENQKGKFECWIILEAEKNAGIYLGFKKGFTKIHLKEYIDLKKNVSEILNFYPVSPGDFFVVPPGTIHAIGKGVTLVEVQQSSGVTYRVWDWNRVDQQGNPRELHVKKAFDVLVDDLDKNTNEYFQFQSKLFDNNQSVQNLIKHEDFNLELYSLSPNESLSITLITGMHSSLVVLEGEMTINELNVLGYQSFFIKDLSELKIKALKKTHFILVK